LVIKKKRKKQARKAWVPCTSNAKYKEQKMKGVSPKNGS
jgi:hypothetical protein